MDPDTTYESWVAAVADNDREGAADAAEALLRWVTAGGAATELVARETLRLLRMVRRARARRGEDPMRKVDYEVRAVDRAVVDVTIFFGAGPAHTTRTTVAELADAASQADRVLAGMYRPILREARAAVYRLEAARQRELLQRSIDRCDGHRVDRTVDERCYTGCVAHRPYTDCHPAAHGNVVYTETCRCGAARRRAANQCHEEVGPWGNPLL